MPIRPPLDKLLPILVGGTGVALGEPRTGAIAGLVTYFLAKSAASLRRSI